MTGIKEIPPLLPPFLLALTKATGECFPGNSPGALWLRAKMVAAGLRERHQVELFLSPPAGSALADAMRVRPELIGALVWPYQCAAWTVQRRLHRILSHYREIDRLGEPLKFPADRKLILQDLGDCHEGMRIVLDQPKWFMREGGLTLNLFIGDFRAVSLAFSLYRSDSGALEAFVGCVQGRNVEDIIDTYRTLTKTMYGLRPRDLLIEYFRLLCRHIGVEGIRAVAEDYRHHRHPFFRKTDYPTNFDDIWMDRGGIRTDQYWFSLPVTPDRRRLEDVKPNKRSLYRKRYAFLDDLEASAGRSIGQGEISDFADT